MVYLFLTSGHETIEALTVVDLFRRAKLPITTVSITSSISVTSSLGITVNADALFEDCDFLDLDALILPGGPGHMSLYEYEPLRNLIVQTHKKEKIIGAICAAPIILETLGIHIKSTIFPTMANQLTHYVDEDVWKDGHIITGRAMGASIPFALTLIKTLSTSDTAIKVSKDIVYH